MVLELKQNKSSGSNKSCKRLNATTNSKRRNGVASKSIVESLLAAVTTSLKFNSFNSRDTSQTSATTATTSESALGDFPPGTTRLQQGQSNPALIQSENTASTHQKNSTEPTTSLDGTDFDVASTNTMAFSMIDWDDNHYRKGTEVEVVITTDGNHRKGKEPTKALSKKMTPKKYSISLRNIEADSTIPVLRRSSSFKETATNNDNNKKKTKSNSVCKKRTKDINNSGKNGSSSVENAITPTSSSKAAFKQSSRALTDGSQRFITSSKKATAKSSKILSGSSSVSKTNKPFSLSAALAATPSEAPPPPLSQGPGDGHSRTSGGSSSIRSTNSPRRPRNTLTIERVIGTWTPHDNLESFQSSLGNGHHQQEQQQQRGRSCQSLKRFLSVNGIDSSSRNNNNFTTTLDRSSSPKRYGSHDPCAMMDVIETPASQVPKLPQSKRDLSRSRHRGSANDTTAAAAAAACTEIQKPSSMPNIFSPVVCSRQRRSGSKRLLSLQQESAVVAANVRPSTPTRGHSLPLSSSSSHSRGRSPSKRYYESKQCTPVNTASPRRRRRHSVQSIGSRDTCTTTATTPSDTGRPLPLSHRKSSSSHDALKPLFLDIDNHQRGDDEIIFITPWEESQAVDAIDEKLDMTVIVPIKMKRPSSCSKLKTTDTKNKRERSSSRSSKQKFEPKKKISSSKKSSSARSLKTSSSNSSDDKKKQSHDCSFMLNGNSPSGESKIPMSTTLPVIQEKKSSSKKASSSSSTMKNLSRKKSVVVDGKNNAISPSDTNSSPTKKKKKKDKSSLSSSNTSENL
ncbi:hypothetical protein IV203_004647 [Nitzschia inconspicua]|uniref:Uncharacterized protein n=1 Tax=Nitzschia inconspicua TaxID=303405 RepID=A0A9K3L5Q2_9STRA|nr:hypothetical protein IV203_004647 [Nitzschia inconspicua]